MRLLNILPGDKIFKMCPSDIKIHEFAEHSLYDAKLAMLLCSSVHIQVFDKNLERLCVIRMISNFERKFGCSNLIRMFMYEI